MSPHSALFEDSLVAQMRGISYNFKLTRVIFEEKVLTYFTSENPLDCRIYRGGASIGVLLFSTFLFLHVGEVATVAIVAFFRAFSGALDHLRIRIITLQGFLPRLILYKRVTSVLQIHPQTPKLCGISSSMYVSFFVDYRLSLFSLSNQYSSFAPSRIWGI